MSHKDKFKYANFPNNFIRNLKRTCKVPVSSLSKHFQEKNDLAERKAVKLNKLESFLLKLVIPFIRIAHCSRGPYLKVQGDLILISADVSHQSWKLLRHLGTRCQVGFGTSSRFLRASPALFLLIWIFTVIYALFGYFCVNFA